MKNANNQVLKINTELSLRPWSNDDLEDLVKYANNWNIAKYMTDQFPYPYTLTDGRAFISRTIAANPTQVFAISLNEKAIGGIGVHPQDDIHRRNAELGYWLAEPYWGQGIVSSSIHTIVHYAFRTFDIDRIFARPFGTNLASQRVLEKNHFTLEGRFAKTLVKNGEYTDELIYAIRKEHLNAPTGM